MPASIDINPLMAQEDHVQKPIEIQRKMDHDVTFLLHFYPRWWWWWWWCTARAQGQWVEEDDMTPQVETICMATTNCLNSLILLVLTSADSTERGHCFSRIICSLE
jgi:hypothetical protein